MRLSIRYKILGTYALVFLLFVGLVISSLHKMRTIDQRLQVVEQGYIPALTITNNIGHLYHLSDDFDADKIRSNLSNKLLLDSLRYSYPELIKKNLGEIDALMNLYILNPQQQLRATHDLPDSLVAGLFIALHQVKVDHQRYQEIINQYLQLQAANKTEKQIEQQIIAQRDHFRNAVRTLSSRLNNVIQKEITHIGNLERRGTWFTVAFSAAAAFLVLALAVLVLVMLRPIQQLILGAQRIAQGDYQQRVQIKSGDEVGLLADEFNRMASSIAQRNIMLENLSHYNQNIIQNIGAGLLVVDDKIAIRSVNRALLTMLGLNEAALFSKTIDQTPLPEVKELHRHCRDVLSSGQMAGPIVVVFAGQNAAEKLLEIRFMPLTESDHKVAGVIMIVDDVTEATQMRLKLIQNEKLAAVGQLSAQITHEIRNPLNAIGLNISLLREDLQSLIKPESQEMFEAIEREIRRLNKVAEHYLQFSRGGQKSAALISVNSILEDIAYLMREEFSRLGIKIHSELADNISRVAGDADQIKQAILNLVKNAGDAIGEKGGNIWLRTRRDGEQVVIEIADDGPGIPKMQQSKIFDPFFTTKAKGTGLGLALTQKIVQEQQGSISCTNRPGGGTVFVIRLPIEK